MRTCTHQCIEFGIFQHPILPGASRWHQYLLVGAFIIDINVLVETTKHPHLMENWKQERYNEINRAIERIQRRAEKVLQAINTLHNEDQQQHQQQQLQPQPQPQSRPRSQQQQRSQHQQDQRQEDQQDQQHRRRQQQQKVSNLTSELARLQDMNDRLLDFRDRLCFYSNLGYVESLNEWQYEIRK